MANPGDKYEAMVDYIRTFIAEHGYSPTVREMQDDLCISSTSVVNYRMRILQRAGRITWSEGASRTVRVIGDPVGLVIRLTGDEASAIRDLIGDGDPKALLMQAVTDYANGLVPTRR